MTQPKGFFKEGGKTKPRFEKKGISEEMFNSSKKVNADMIKIEKDLKTEVKPRFIHREPVIGYVKGMSPVTLRLELEKAEKKMKGVDGKEYENPLKLSMSDSIWNFRESDIIQGGQGQDTLREYLKKGELRPAKIITKQEIEKLLDVWDKYHLNDMKAGTSKQNKFVDEYFEKHKDERYEYGKVKNLLKEHGLDPDNGYEYGTSSLYEPIPKDVENFVREMQKKLNLKEDGKPKE